MNNEKDDNKPLEDMYAEISSLKAEISSLKAGTSELISLLKQKNQQINRIERRIEAFFPCYKKLENLNDQKIDNTKENLLKIYDELVIATEKGENDFNQMIKKYSKETIKALALEKGVSVGSNKKAIEGIKNCIHESIQLQKPLLQDGLECFK